MENIKNKNTIVIIQPNSIVGDVEYNKNKAIENIKKAIELNADLIIFPELFLVGNPIGDILNKYPYIAKQCQEALDEIKNYSQKINILIGYCEFAKQESDKKFFNSVAYIKNQKIEKNIQKSFLTNNQIFCEAKTFESAYIDINNRIIEINNVKYGIILSKELESNSLNNFISILAPNVDIIINISAYESRYKIESIQENQISQIAKKHNINFIQTNQIGANDEVVFSGSSKVFNKKGELILKGKAFEEDFIIINSKTNFNPIEIMPIHNKEFSLDYSLDLKRTYEALILAIKDYFQKNNLKKAVLGLSGGLDSTICAVLLADALGNENVLGVSMPSKLTSSESKNDAKELAQNLKINFIEVPIKDMQDSISTKFQNIFSEVEALWDNRCTQSFTQDNIQARSRAMILWGIANEFAQAIPIATSDKSELYMGYATINGDMSGGFAPICDVVKTKLFALATWMNENRKTKNAIPKSIIEKPPGAELAINPKTGKTLLAEDALMPYEFMDEVIWRIENLNQSIEDMMKIEFLYEKKNITDEKTKKAWLDKFFKRLNFAQYKSYIIPPGPIIDSFSISKAEFKQPISSNINYLK